MLDLEARRSTFRSLHREGCFVCPNPWDRGSAIVLERLGFRALATSSAGLAFSRGAPDSMTALPRAVVLDHVRELVAATRVPVSADLQSGYASDPGGVAESVRLCIAAGAAGLSIEDASDCPERPLFELAKAIDRLRAARAAIDASGVDVVLTARAECFLVGHPAPLAESIRRLQAYAEVGADVLFAPGLRTREEIRAVVEAVAPVPVNVLVGAHLGIRVEELAELGVRRVSVGSALARAAWTAFMRAARAIADEGDFRGFDGIATIRELSGLFAGASLARGAGPG